MTTATKGHSRGQRVLGLPQGAKLGLGLFCALLVLFWVVRLIDDGPELVIVVNLIAGIFQAGYWSSMWWVDRGRTAEPIASLRGD